MNAGMKTFLLWMAVLLAVYLFVEFSNNFKGTIVRVDFSEFQKDLREGKVTKLSIRGSEIAGERKDAAGQVTKFSTNGPGALDSDFIKELEAAKVPEYKFEPADDGRFWIILSNLLPVIIIVILFFVFMRNLQVGGGKAMNFGKSRAKLLREDERGRITFKDVAGLPEAKEELEEIVEFLKDPKKFQKLGGRIPKGVLLMGAPGTGKTLIAKAIAGEANVPFFTISGSDFVEMFVGVGASRVRDMFAQARKAAPCLIFIDEIDAVGRQRGAGLGGGHDEREQTLNQLLVEMDGFEGKEGIIMIAATNRPDVLDPALLRPGRFDRRVVVPKPELKGREEILKIHAAKIKTAPDVDLAVIARGTPGFVGADLENICNEAALLAARSNKDFVEMSDFEQAKDKVMMGAERRSVVMNKKEKETTAIHEAGHALVARMIPGTDPVHKVTIIPRGMALGVTMQLPEEDRHNLSEKSANDQIAILFGGRVAEELIFQDVTTGASNDIERATELARKMVTEWGMSSRVGPIHLSNREEHIFLGREISKSSDRSEQTALLVDEEVKTIIMNNYKRTRQILRDNIDKLRKVADYLCEKETIDGAELDRLIFGVDSKPASLVKSAS
jgi:cell division protease FtsH